MECFNCGAIIDEAKKCPYCGADNRMYRRIIHTSNALYNDGLERAEARDITGAISCLQRSLKYNKYHIEARNLLGLCYYEIGETVQALAQWVISKNLQPDGNPVDAYLKHVQAPGELDKMNNTIKKYNQALHYCEEGNRDLAKIQLRRVIGMNPKLVKAHQLLALCYLAEENYGEARKLLAAANHIDSANPQTLRYIRETRVGMKAQNKKAKKKRRSETANMVDGTETPQSFNQSLLDVWDNTKAGLLNIIIGLIIGLLICVFLIIPTVKQNNNSTTANALVNANKAAQTSDSNISSLEKQVEELQKELENYTGKADIVTSYENLITAQGQVAAEDLAGAAQSMTTINRDLLSGAGQAAYDAVAASVQTYQLQSAYEAGHKAYLQKNYAEAITQYTTSTGIDPAYEDGRGLFEMADSYAQTGDNANAIATYEKLITEQPGSELKKKSVKALEALGITTNDDGTFVETPSEEAAQ